MARKPKMTKRNGRISPPPSQAEWSSEICLAALRTGHGGESRGAAGTKAALNRAARLSGAVTRAWLPHARSS